MSKVWPLKFVMFHGVFLFILLITGCAAPGSVVVEGEEGRVIIESGSGGGQYPQGPRGESKIPPGHMPPPGKCRIWYPDLPPGQQPPPGECRDLQYRVPPGAWLIRG
jgi:hypothetical protein